jgi:hypothetical protein
MTGLATPSAVERAFETSTLRVPIETREPFAKSIMGRAITRTESLASIPSSRASRSQRSAITRSLKTRIARDARFILGLTTLLSYNWSEEARKS